MSRMHTINQTIYVVKPHKLAPSPKGQCHATLTI